MLIGAYGRDAERRIVANLRSDVPALPGKTETLVRGELALAWSSHQAPAIAERSGNLCLLDGEITALPESEVGRMSPRREGPGGITTPCSPSELLNAWECLGDSVVEGLRGSFVLALWDAARRRGLVVRDPTGLSPLVRFDLSGCLLFASEIRQLLAVLPHTPPPDQVAVSFWLSNDNCWDERTMFEGVRPLRAGHMLVLEDGRVRERAWWQVRYSPPPRISLQEAAETVAEAIERSIATQMRADEDVGVLLSGGIDSTSVAALARRGLEQSGSRLTAYSATFPNQPQADESELISETCAHIGIPSVQMAVHGGSPLGGALQFIRDWLIPSVTANSFFWPALQERIRGDGCRLLLGGEGGDELFRLSPPLMADCLRGGRPLAALRFARRVPGGDRQRLHTLARLCLREAAASTLPQAALRKLRLPRSRWTREPEWLRPELATLHRATANPLRWRELDGPRWWAFRAHVLTVGREIVGVSDQIRRLEQRDGIRVHHPLLDLDVVELVLGLPPDLDYSPRFSRPVLRTAVQGLIPQRVRTRVGKSDFLPVLLAAVSAGDLLVARELLLAPNARIREFTQPELVRDRVLETQPELYTEGPAGWALDLWRLLSVECWLQAQEDPAHIATLSSRVEATRTSFHLESPPV
jgi:asparagine synthase (glutamine-hydrolysing)